MLSASAVRLQIESALAHRIPSALTPQPKLLRPVAATGIAAIDDLLEGGLPVGAISELTGAECSGRTSVAMAFLAGLTQGAKVCAWVDVSDAFDPVSAAAADVDLERLLWVRCGVEGDCGEQQLPGFVLPEKYTAPPPVKKGLHGGGFGPHPRTESRGLEQAIPELPGPRCAEPQRKTRREREPARVQAARARPVAPTPRPVRAKKPWSRIDQALRATDLLLQTGGFSAIVLDMGSLAPEVASRVPMATWFRYRAAAERTQASLLLLTQAPCAKSSAEMLLRLEAGSAPGDEETVFTGLEHQVEALRRRFAGNNSLPPRKPPQRVSAAGWRSRARWAGEP